MFKLHFPFDVSSVGRVSGHAILNGGSLPLHTATAENALRADEFVKVAARIVAGLDSHPPPSRAPADSFGDKLKRAVQTRLAARSGHKTIAASADDEGFAEKLKAAVKKKVAQRAPQPAPCLQRRKASKGE
jgi:hypothetical protein